MSRAAERQHRVRRPSRAFRRTRRRFPLGIERVEERMLLSGNIFTVNSLGDTGTGTGTFGDLRYAITQANANPGSRIVFDVTGSILLRSALPDLSANVNLAGPGSGTVDIVGGGAFSNFSVLTIDHGVTATVSGLTISGGHAANGGGINNAGSLTLSNSVVTGNSASASGGGINNTGTLIVLGVRVRDNSTAGNGGGIADSGALRIENSTISGNTATTNGGGLYEAPDAALAAVLGSTFSRNSAQVGAGIDTAATLTLTNSTVADNSASGPGGGVASTGTLTLTNATLTANRAGTGFGGGISNGAAGELLLNNTLIAANFAGASASTTPADVAGAVMPTSAYNLIGDGDHLSGISNGTQGNQIGSAAGGSVINAHLLPLDPHGGPTETVGLLPNSPALNAGSNALAIDPNNGQPLLTDQRGPGFARVANGIVDIGAVESQAPPLAGNVYTVDSLGDTGAAADLRYAITQANSNPGSAIVFNVTGTIQLASALPALGANMTIIGPGTDLLAIAGGGPSSGFAVLTVSKAATVSVSGLTITDGTQGVSNAGSATFRDVAIANNQNLAGSGGGVSNTGALTLIDSSVTGNLAYNSGGIASRGPGNSLTIIGSSVSHNAIAYNGGAAGIYEDNGPLTLTNSTVLGNNNGPGIVLDHDAGMPRPVASLVNDTIAANATYGVQSSNNVYVTNVTVVGNGFAGLKMTSGGLFTLNNSLVGDNGVNGAQSDIVGTVGSISANNVIGNGDGLIGISDGAQGNEIGSLAAHTVIVPDIGPPADNGGPTLTMVPLAGSAAIDAGKNALVIGATDQRGTGFPRISRGSVDVGAVEYQVAAVIATQLVVTVSSSPVYLGNPFSITVAVTDSSGNTALDYNGPVTLSLANNPGGETLGGTLTVFASDGIATFPGLTLDKAGSGYTIQATSGSLPAATSASFDVDPVTATQLVTIRQPSSAVAAGTPFTIVIAAEDSQGHVDTTFDGSVSISSEYIDHRILYGTLTVAAVSGVATFSDLTITLAHANQILDARTSSGLSVQVRGINIIPGAAANLSISSPANPVAIGNPFSIAVSTYDAVGNLDTLYSGPVTIALADNPGGAHLGGITTVNAVNGVATFAGLTLDEAGTGYTIQATAGNASPVTTSPFNVFPVTGTQLAFTSQPPAGLDPGTGFGLTVAAEDGAGHVDTTFNGSVTLALANNPSGATLGGTLTVNAVDGVASFSGLSLDKGSTGYTIQATTAGLTSGTTAPFDVVTVVPTQVVVITQPPLYVAQGNSFALTVAAEDTSGNVDATFNGSVTVMLSSSPGSATLGGTLSVNAVNGIATFSDLTLDQTGRGYQIQASAVGLTTATTAPFSVDIVIATHFVVTTQPPASVKGTGAIFSFAVTAEDASGNVDTTFTGPVTVSFANNPSGAVLSGDNLTISAVNGVATFTGLASNGVGGGFTLMASSPGLSPVMSDPFNVLPASADHLVINMSSVPAVVGGGFTVAVTAVDASGKPDPTYNGVITLTLANNPTGATFSGTLSVKAARGQGIAQFNFVSLNKAGTGYTIEASDGVLTPAISPAFTIATQQSANLTMVNQPPATVTAGAPFNLSARTFLLGNYNGDVTVSLASNPGNATLGGTLTVRAVDGLARFSGLTLDRAGSGYTIQVTAAGMKSVTTTAFDVTAGTATHLAIGTEPPSSVKSGSAFSLAVAVEDRNGNIDTSFAGNVTLVLANNSGGATLGGKLTVAASHGVAAFSGLTLNKAANGYTINVSASGLTGATTSPINVTAPATPLRVLSISPKSGNYSVLKDGRIVVTFNQPLAGLTPDVASGGGFASNPFAVSLKPRGPSGVFAAPSGLDAGSVAIHATLVYHVNANGTSTITLYPRAPLGTDYYIISVSGALTSKAGVRLTNAAGQTGPEYETFKLIATPPNTTRLKVVSVTTLHASVNIKNGATIPQPDTIAIGFNKPVDFLTTNIDTVQLRAAGSSTPVPAAVAYSPTTKTVYLTPEAKLIPGTKYTVRVAGTVTDDQTFPKPDTRYSLGAAFTRSFMVRSGAVKPGSGPFVALSTNGHLNASPHSGTRSAPFGYASIPFSQTVDLASLGRYSVELTPQTGGLNNNAFDTADTPLNAQIAFNPNTNDLIIVPTVLLTYDTYRYSLTNMRSTTGKKLTNPGGKLPVYDTFQLSVSAAHGVAARPTVSRRSTLVASPRAQRTS